MDKTIVFLKYFGFFILVVISSLLSLNLMTGLVRNPIEQFLLGSLSIGLEFLKVFLLLKANIISSLKRKFSKVLKAYFFYSLLAVLSLTASFGFILTGVSSSQKAAEVSSNSFLIAQKEEALAEKKASIEDLKLKLNSINAETYRTAYDQQNERVKAAEKERDSIIKEINDLKQEDGKKETESTSSSNMYFEISKVTGINNEGLVKLLILGFLSIILEAGIISLSPTVKVTPLILAHIINEHVQINTTPEVSQSVPSKKPKVEEPKVKPRPPQQKQKKTVEEKPQEIPSNKEGTIKNVPVIPHEENVKVYRFGKGTQENVKIFNSFMKELFDTKDDSLQDISDISGKMNVPIEKITPFFNSILLQKGPTGSPLIEKRADGKYYPCYTKQYIYNTMTKEIVK